MVKKQIHIMKNDAVLPPVSDALLREYREYFLDFDDDGDGKLSKIEFMKMVENTGVELDFQEMKKAYNAADSDGDGMITFRNFLAAYSRGVANPAIANLKASSKGRRPLSEQLSIRTPADRKQRYYSDFYPDTNRGRNGLLRMIEGIKMEKASSPREESKAFITESKDSICGCYSDDESVVKPPSNNLVQDPFHNRRAKSLYAPTRHLKEIDESNFTVQNTDAAREKVEFRDNLNNNSNGNSPKLPLSKQISDDPAIRNRRGLSLHLAMNPDEEDVLSMLEERRRVSAVGDTKSPIKELKPFAVSPTEEPQSRFGEKECRGSTRRNKKRLSKQDHGDAVINVVENKFEEKERGASIRRNKNSYDSIDQASFGERDTRGFVGQNKHSFDSTVDRGRFADKDSRRSLRRPRRSKQEAAETTMKRNTCHFDYYSATKPEETDDHPRRQKMSFEQQQDEEAVDNKEENMAAGQQEKRLVSKMLSELQHPRRKMTADGSPKLPLRQQFSDDIVARKGSPKAQNRARSSTPVLLSVGMDQSRRGSGQSRRGSGVYPPAEAHVEFRKRFQDMDKTGDGKLQWSEILKLTENVGLELKAKQASEVYKVVNESEDGRISYKAFIDAYTKQVATTPTSPTTETQKLRRENSVNVQKQTSSPRRPRSATVGPTSNLAPTRDSVKSWLARRQEPSSAKLKNLLGTELKEHFKCFWSSDLDYDGKLSTQEFSRMLERLGMKLNTKDLNKAFVEADENRDGKISFNEFLSTYFDRNILQVLSPGQIQNQLSKMSGDCRLNKAECFHIMKQFGNDLSEKQLNRFMRLMKNDADGQVSLDELYMFLGFSF